jgi:Zn-dependent membrane protease YugP
MTSTLMYLVLGATWLFALVVQRRMKATYARYSAMPNRAGLPGAAVARRILDANGLERVNLEVAPGKLTDHYDPRTLAIRLSPDNARDASVAAMAVSAHEAAHALQDADDYRPLELRTAMYPVVRAGARFGIPAAILGSSVGSQALFFAGMLGYVGSIFFHFITLPVEFNASRRALAQLKRLGITRGKEEEDEARKTLRAAAMTYVAGAASAAGFLLIVGVDVLRGLGLGRVPKGRRL